MKKIDSFLRKVGDLPPADPSTQRGSVSPEGSATPWEGDAPAEPLSERSETSGSAGASPSHLNGYLKSIVFKKTLPKHTALLQNFPNPFNPDTWIPYELATDVMVTIRIYNVKGQLIRQLDLGKQKVGRYFDKEKAAYWDGKGQTGEAVSSGIYFYTLKAGDFQATRRMVILK